MKKITVSNSTIENDRFEPGTLKALLREWQEMANEAREDIEILREDGSLYLLVNPA